MGSAKLRQWFALGVAKKFALSDDAAVFQAGEEV
jgi:hypothetical protein